MEFAFYLFAIIGCVSFGYSLLRIGFPEKQDAEIKEKIGYSYVLGILVILPSLLMFQFISIYGFFVIACVVYFILAIGLLVFRLNNHKKDNADLLENKHKIPILIKDQLKENSEKTTNSSNNNIKKPQIFKVKNTNQIKENAKIKDSNNEIKGDNEKEKKKTLSKLKLVIKELDDKKKKKLNEDDELEDLIFE